MVYYSYTRCHLNHCISPQWVLNKRLWTLSVYTGVPVFASTALLALFTKNIFSFSAILAIPTFASFLCGAFILPLVILRRWDIEPTSNPPTSKSAFLSFLLKSSKTYRTVGITSLSFAAFAIGNALCAASLGAHNWHLFAPTKRHSSNLNENVLFLTLGTATVGAILAVFNLTTMRTRVHWPIRITLTPHALFNEATASFGIQGNAFSSVFFVTIYSIAYWWFRKAVYRNLMRLPLVGSFFKPFIFQAARPSTSLSIFTYLLPRLVVLILVTVLHYENVQAWFDSVSSQGMLLSSESIDPDACLRSGLESPSEYYQHFAYLELCYIARRGPASRRISIYHDPSKWNFISRSCFKILGEDYGLLKRRGKPPPPPAAAPPPPPTPAALHPLSTPRKSNIANLGASVYKPLPPPSPGSLLIKSLLSASSASPATSSSVASTSPSGTVGSPGGEGLRSPLRNGGMPNIFVMQPPGEEVKLAAAAPAATGGDESVVALVKKGVGFVVGKLTARVPSIRAADEPFIVIPGFLKGFKATMDKELSVLSAEGILRRRSLDILCVEILVAFTVESLREDAYGTLQQDIPRVLEVLTKELIALEDYEAELVANANDGTRDLEEVKTAQRQVLSPLMEGITRGLREIIMTFGDRLNVFRLPLPIARKLQIIADVI